MTNMARVHYEIDDDLHRRAKAAAAMEGITLKSLIEEGMELRITAAGLVNSDIRSELAEKLEWEADWRRHIAEEWPDDERNPRAAALIQSAADIVRGLPSDDERLGRIRAAYAPFGTLGFGEDAHLVLKAAGFQGARTADELLNLLAAAADHDLDSEQVDDEDDHQAPDRR